METRLKPGQLCKLQGPKGRKLSVVSKNTDGTWPVSEQNSLGVKVSKRDVLMVVALTEFRAISYRSNCYVLLHGEKTVLCNCDLIEAF